MTTPRITLPSSRARGGWTVNPRAIREACEVLGIQRPVIVKLSAGRQRMGAHRDRPDGHSITVSTYLTPDRASVTLWHELTHAAQTEALNGPTWIAQTRSNLAPFNAAYRQENSTKGYRRNRFEVEARQTGWTMSVEYPVTNGIDGRPAYVPAAAAENALAKDLD